ncbi:MAG: M12 family metallo-peptidase [Crocinitomicaceae bacterium]|nr:M12 family metallo-peptidase [Crocinitomicaceae bacterium]MDG2464989.1 M12 family metallo-peptidase [Crocinitomicaceae bacterium]
MMKLTYIGAMFCALISFSAVSQNFFQDFTPTQNQINNQVIKTTKSTYYTVDLSAMISAIQSAPYRENVDLGNSTFFIQLPNLTGGFKTYKVLRNQIMHPQLNVLYPDILTFDGVNVSNVLEKVKLDITPQGFHAMITSPGHSTIFIDPIHSALPNKVMAYYKKDFYTNKQMSCEFESREEKLTKLITSDASPEYGTCQLRTYRLALAATAEYTAYHTNATLAAAAQVTTMNRVNGVFERDIAITMTLVPNNNLLIYTNASTDPYTNGNAGAMINQNVTACNGQIGSTNFDIGHVFGTNSGGLAGLGVVCGSNKARGVTGSSNPVGDPFDIDYVAHEMGHQFNANHTQNNNCNRNNPTAVEPGSASTIMGYAGICSPNVQSNSDDHFHGINLSEIHNLITSTSHTCPVLTTLMNSAPVITAGPTTVYVPVSTPFALNCIATDVNGDTLTYNWEQTDNQVSTQPPVSTSTGGPNFRSLPSSTNPTRYFPKLVDLAAGGPFTWEVVPSVARTMNFRCSVRDNSAGPGGCSDHVNVAVTSVAAAGPFVVTYPNANGIIWAGSSTQTVTWSVANTTAAPISAATVDIYLSTDGGLTFPTLLLAGTTNDGSQAITVPSTATTTARIMVISAAGIFFDISNNNFEITASTFDYVLNVSPTNLSVCQGANGAFNVTSSSIGGYSAAINLSALNVPGGATPGFSSATITPGQQSTLTISNAPVGSYSMTIEGNSGGNIHTLGIVLDVLTNSISAPTILSPTNGATNTSSPTNLTWSAVPGAASYSVDISTSATFTTMVDQATGLVNPNYTTIILNPSTTYYWRVNAINACATSTFVQASYTTGTCSTISSPNVPVAISASGTPTVTSIINIPQTGFVSSVRIPKVQGTHSWVSDLTFNLISPTGTSIQLFTGICTSLDDFDLGLDDAATTGAIPCPPTTGLYYQPTGSLASLTGEQIQGNWTLEVTDGVNQDGGSLDFWSLELCVTANPCNQPDVPVVSGPTSICAGETATLSVTGNLNDATQWQWYSGSCGGTMVGTGTSLSVNPTANTNYFVRGTGGCVTNATCTNQTISVTTLNINLTQNGNQLTSLAPSATYQWLLCSDNYSVIPGATSVTFTPTLTIGSYAVQIQNNGCLDTSACFVIDQAGLDELSKIELTISPNPTNDFVNLTWSESAFVEAIEIVDAKGKLVYSIGKTDGNKHMIDLTNLESAVYFVRVQHQFGLDNLRIVKAK